MSLNSWLIRLTVLTLLQILELTFFNSVNGLCIFGEGGDCKFPCHCNGASTGGCDAYTGKCSLGCQKGKPGIYGDWQSDGCLLGNVAYNKATSSNTVITSRSKKYNRPHLWYNTNKTVDGLTKVQVFDGSCAVVYTGNKTTLPWILFDLGKQYTIPKVLVMNTDNSIDSSYLETFYIRVGNTTDIDNEQAVCKKYYSKISTSGKETIACEKPLVGRYVSIKKYSERNKVGRLPLCEMVIFGYEAIEVKWEKCYQKSSYNMFCKKCMGTKPPDCIEDCPDNSYGEYCEGICGHCNDSGTCDKITGKCNMCEIGWKPPKCDVACPNATYGHNCVYMCGNCKDDNQCDLVTGICPYGCQPWYADDDVRCNTFIAVKDFIYQPQILFIKNTWVTLALYDIEIQNSVQKYYTIKVFYLHENNPRDKLQEYNNFTVNHNNESDSDTLQALQVEIHGLSPNRQYWFVLQVFRQDKNHSEGGIKSTPIKIMTLNSQFKEDNKEKLLNPESISKKNSPPSSHLHHTNTTIIVLSLLLVIILLNLAVCFGILLFKKYWLTKHTNRGLPSSEISFGQNKQTSPQDNICYDSQTEIINQLDVMDDTEYSHLVNDN